MEFLFIIFKILFLKVCETFQESVFNYWLLRNKNVFIELINFSLNK